MGLSGGFRELSTAKLSMSIVAWLVSQGIEKDTRVKGGNHAADGFHLQLKTQERR
jgi:hypothetical protein